MIGTPLLTCGTMLLLGRSFRSSLSIGLALAQIGEFSFIVAALGMKLNVLPPEATQALVATAILSISVNPLLYRSVRAIERWTEKRPRLWNLLTARSKQSSPRAPQADPTLEPRYRAVVVGYGPVGRTLMRLLIENDISPTVIEMNLQTVRWLRTEGIPAVYGDATHLETLKEAGVPTAGSIFLTSSGLTGAQEVVRLARLLNPAVRVVARATYLRERPDLMRAGADAVFAGEGEVALAMTESLLRQLGASPEQIDRERDRVRVELTGQPALIDMMPVQVEAPVSPPPPAG
jgi:CPA2 family monovalent cation:H+ antiporter-2